MGFENYLPITKVAVRYDMNARRIIMIVLGNQPASWKAAGNVSAPVPTIRLNIYIQPVNGE